MTDDQRRWLYYAIPVVVVIGLGVALYYWRIRQAPPEPPVAQTAPQQSVEPPVQHPIPAEEQPEPLPTLDESDAPVQESLAETFGRALQPFLVPEDIIRNVVVTVDNLPRKKLAVTRRPLQPTPGELVVSGAGDVTLSERNYERYAPLVKVVQSADAAQVAAVYRHYYPLLQQAYVDLGYPDGYFNDRLVEVIDHLLATPEIQGPIRLTQPSVFYEFADPSIEERSAGQKLLIRMGPQNAAVIKTKLRELRAVVANQEREEPPAP